MVRVRSHVAVLACVTGLMAGACNRGSSLPFEPQAQAQAWSVTVSAGADGPAGTLTLTTATCPCVPKGFAVAIDGVAVGTIGCAEQRQFVVTGSSYTLSLSAPGWSFTVKKPAPDTGVTYFIRCGS